MPAPNLDNHKALDSYYAKLADYHSMGVTHEGAVSKAFADLLDTLAPLAGWKLVPQQKLINNKVPDGTLYQGIVPRGYWEAKDTKDDLDAEIKKKAKIYPLTNIIFEDTRRAVLYQNGQEAARFDLAERAQLQKLLEKFFGHTNEQIEEFKQAVAKFREDIPRLATGLMLLIEEERAENAEFVGALADFHDLCRTSINPGITLHSVEEMLVQHLLTKRLITAVLNQTQFAQRNVIAAEIEKVIAALTRRKYTEAEFFGQLDYFYEAIENYARSLTAWDLKQALLNDVYELFFQSYAKDSADTHGIVYTPQPIVAWMWRAVDDVLQSEFGQSLSQPGVKILDPCTGTGNFLVHLLQVHEREGQPFTYIKGQHLAKKYQEDLFANEIMLLPYYVASLNIERAFFERQKNNAPFEGLCFADTLDLAEPRQPELFVKKNTERVTRQKTTPITVIIGNPPYNVGQKNENDNNKNRRYNEVDKRVRETYMKGSRATNKNALGDLYVKFFRWATDRLQGKDGVVCFVSNNGFLNGIAFDGFRKSLRDEFTHIYHFDFKGNARTSGERRRAEGGNIFRDQIRTGVGITVLVRKGKPGNAKVFYHGVEDYASAWDKEEHLLSFKGIKDVPWQEMVVDKNGNWLLNAMDTDYDAFLPIGTKAAKAHWGVTVKAIFKNYGGGVKTNRDEWAYDWNKEALSEKVGRFIDFYNAEVARWEKRDTHKDLKIDDFVNNDSTKIKWSRDLKLDLKRGQLAAFTDDKVRNAIYRPFCKRLLFLDRVLNEEVYVNPKIFPLPDSENKLIWLKVGITSDSWALATNAIPDILSSGGTQCFPFYTYSEDGLHRTDNITDWALSQFRAAYGASVTKEEIFHYVYAVLHHPTYRTRYAENLKRELPRIPLLKDEGAGLTPTSKRGASEADSLEVGASPAVPASSTFAQFVAIGAQLANLHLNYESAPEYPLRWVETDPTQPFSWRVEKMKRIGNSLVINDSLTLEGIPDEALRYRLGNRSALDWLVDQYKLETDARSGLVSDPNRESDPEYIVRLIGRVVEVSVQTVRLIEKLPEIDPGPNPIPGPSP